MAIDYDLRGKRALVTGGSHGIGFAIAHALAREGCHISICSRTLDRLNKAAVDLRKTGSEVLTFQADVLFSDQINQVTGAIDRAWGGIDILINNVGGGGRWGKSVVEQTPFSVWQDVYQKNAGASAAFLSWAIPAMRQRKWGRVVAIASIHGRQGGGRPWFTAAKAAQIATMKSLAMMPYLVRDGITFNTIAPGPIMIPDTGWSEERDRDPQSFAARVDAEFRLGRLGTPEEVAAVALFLCSMQASLINGACIAVDGGESSAL
jgi:3-oxoacyl-[acyl-carrier protein] reductase